MVSGDKRGKKRCHDTKESLMTTDRAWHNPLERQVYNRMVDWALWEARDRRVAMGRPADTAKVLRGRDASVPSGSEATITALQA